MAAAFTHIIGEGLLDNPLRRSLALMAGLKLLCWRGQLSITASHLSALETLASGQDLVAFRPSRTSCSIKRRSSRKPHSTHIQRMIVGFMFCGWRYTSVVNAL